MYARISSHRNSGRPLMQKDNIITHLETLISLLCGKQSKRALGGELLWCYHRRCKWQDFTFLGQVALHWLQLFHFPNTFSEQLSFRLIPHFGCYILNSAAMNLGVWFFEVLILFPLHICSYDRFISRPLWKFLVDFWNNGSNFQPQHYYVRQPLLPPSSALGFFGLFISIIIIINALTGTDDVLSLGDGFWIFDP